MLTRRGKPILGLPADVEEPLRSGRAGFARLPRMRRCCCGEKEVRMRLTEAGVSRPYSGTICGVRRPKLRAAGVPESVVMAMGGWKTPAMSPALRDCQRADQRSCGRETDRAQARTGNSPVSAPIFGNPPQSAPRAQRKVQ